MTRWPVRAAIALICLTAFPLVWMALASITPESAKAMVAATSATT